MNIFNRQNVLIMASITSLNLFAIGCTAFVHRNVEDIASTSSISTVQEEDQQILMEDSADTRENNSKDTESFASSDLNTDDENDSSDLNIDGDMSGLYSSILLGRYTVGENIVFYFHSDGSYSGYFDDKNQDVTEYSYDLEYDGTNYLLSIYNPNKSEKVTYYVILTDDTDIVLKYPLSDVEIKLEY